MDIELNAEQSADESIALTVPADTPAKISVSEAGRLLRAARKPKDAPVEAPPEAAAPETQELAPDEGTIDAAPSEAPPVETEEPDAADFLPPVERPRSWSVEEQEAWNALPRDKQERIAERERSRELEIRRRQDEVAEQRKALDAEREATKQQRQQYEQGLEWALMQAVNGPDVAQFADIKTATDARRLASEDPIRYTQYQAWREETKQLADLYVQAQNQKQQEQQSQWATFAEKEDALFAERVPEIKDAEKAAKIRSDATKYLTEGLGFSNQEIAQAWNSPGWRDHRAQLALYHAAKLWNSQQQVKKAPPKPLPPVQRPGVASGSNSTAEQNIKSLEDQLNRTGSAKVAAQLRVARSALAARRG